MKYFVYYCKAEDKKGHLRITYPFLAGDAESEQEANKIAKKLVNETTGQIAVIPHVFEVKKEDEDKTAFNVARKKFAKMAAEMQESQAIMNRRKKKPAFVLGEINIGTKKDSGSVIVHNKPHKISMAQYNVLQTLFEAEDEGYTKEELVTRSGHQNAVLIIGHIIKNPILKPFILLPKKGDDRYRLRV